MANVTMLLNTFLTGELTPKMHGLVTSPYYQMGAELMRNFIPLKNGGFRPRPGTRHAEIATSKYCRLIPFTDTDGTVYNIELTDYEARMFNESHEREESGGSTVVLTTPWPTAALSAIQYAMVGGDMYLVHRSYAPQKITRSGGTWAISVPTFTGSRTFSTANNYPGIVMFYGGRLFLGSTNAEPNAIFGSAFSKTTGAPTYLSFALGTGAAADAIYLLESDMHNRRIGWLANFGYMISGTDKSIWKSDGAIPTPATFDMSLSVRQGAAEIMPQVLEKMLIYVSVDRRSLWGLYYDSDADDYMPICISETADHLFSSGIVDIAVMSNPEPIVWVALENGDLVSATVRRTGSGILAGFGYHTLGGSGAVHALDVIPQADGDELWMVVDRAVNTSIEYLTLDDINTTTIDDCFYVDNGATLTPGSATVSGLTWLDTQTVAAIGDGSVLPEATVESNEVTYDRSIDKIQIGLPYTYRFRNLRPELALNNTWQAKQKQVIEAVFRLYKSYGGEAGQDLDNLTKMLFDTYGDFYYGDTPALFTGDKKVDMASIVDEDGQFYLEASSPLPVIVLAIMLKIQISEV